MNTKDILSLVCYDTTGEFLFSRIEHEVIESTIAEGVPVLVICSRVLFMTEDSGKKKEIRVQRIIDKRMAESSYCGIDEIIEALGSYYTQQEIGL